MEREQYISEDQVIEAAYKTPLADTEYKQGAAQNGINWAIGKYEKAIDDGVLISRVELIEWLERRLTKSALKGRFKISATYKRVIDHLHKARA